MLSTKKSLTIWLTSCAAPLVLLCACATQTPPLDVGSVVVAPKVKLPPPPAVVLTTAPKPVGYFQSQLLDYSNGSPVKPTTSTPPTSPVAPTSTR